MALTLVKADHRIVYSLFFARGNSDTGPLEQGCEALFTDLNEARAAYHCRARELMSDVDELSQRIDDEDGLAWTACEYCYVTLFQHIVPLVPINEYGDVDSEALGLEYPDDSDPLDEVDELFTKAGNPASVQEWVVHGVRYSWFGNEQDEEYWGETEMFMEELSSVGFLNSVLHAARTIPIVRPHDPNEEDRRYRRPCR